MPDYGTPYTRAVLLNIYMIVWIDNGCNLSDRQEEILSNFELLASAVEQFDSRFTLRALRSIASIRKNLRAETLGPVIVRTYPQGDQKAIIFLKAIGTNANNATLFLKKAETVLKADASTSSRRQSIPEIDVFIGILIQVFYILHSSYLIAY